MNMLYQLDKIHFDTSLSACFRRSFSEGKPKYYVGRPQ